MINRRAAIKRLGALAGAAAAPGVLGCGGDGKSSSPRGLTTLVTLCMENRSYDHYLGARSLLEGKPGDGLRAGMSNPDMKGKPVAIRRAPAPCVPDPGHGWGPSHTQWNDGKNDGFLKEYQGRLGEDAPPHVMGYHTRQELPVTWALADAYVSFDRWFCALLGPTWPNRMYLHSAQSNGMNKNELPAGGMFQWRTIHHAMNDAGVEWAYYDHDLPFVPLFKDADPKKRGVRRIGEFFADAAEGKLPPVVFIDPAFAVNDDHPPHHPILGQQLIASIYAALAASPQWNNLLFVVTYDEHGGFFDHVPPPEVADDRAADGFGRMGFRVPTVCAGPYVRSGHVSSTVHDHTSVIRQICAMHKLPPLGARDAAAADLTDALDMDRLARLDPAPPVKLPEVVVDESMIGSACSTISGSSLYDRALDEGVLDRSYDHRAEVREMLYLHADNLARHGAGGIRRG